MRLIIISQFCIDFVRYYDEIILDHNLGDFFQFFPWHDGTGRVVREWHDQDLGTVSDRCAQVISGQAEFVLSFEVDKFRHAVCHDSTWLVCNEGWLRDQNFISRFQHGAHGEVDGLTAAYGYKDFTLGIVGNFVFVLYIFADLLTEFQESGIGSVVCPAFFQAVDTLITDMPWSIKIRFADTERDYVIHFTYDVKKFTYSRWLDGCHLVCYKFSQGVTSILSSLIF